MAVDEEVLTMCSSRLLQWVGIWRPPLAGSVAAPTGLEEHGLGRDAEGEAERAIAVVGQEPVVAGTQRKTRADLQGFMACAGDLEEDFLLALEKDFAVIHAAGEEHQPVDFNQFLRGKVALGDIGV